MNIVEIERISRNFDGFQFDLVDETGHKQSVFVGESVWEELISYIMEEIDLRKLPPALLTEAQYKARLASEGILPEDL